MANPKTRNRPEFVEKTPQPAAGANADTAVADVVPISPQVTGELGDANGSRSLGRHLGQVIRQLRLQHGLTIADISDRANISRGMLSKIENGLVSTSLETLEQIANALGVTLSRLFRDYNVQTSSAQLVKSGQGMEVVRRGTKRGHTYHLLAYDQGPTKTFEPFLITLEDPGEEFPPFEHAGTEFIHMLEGEVEYKVGNETFLLQPGDSLTFRSEQPHRPERLVKAPVRFLSIIHHDLPETPIED